MFKMVRRALQQILVTSTTKQRQVLVERQAIHQQAVAMHCCARQAHGHFQLSNSALQLQMMSYENFGVASLLIKGLICMI